MTDKTPTGNRDKQGRFSKGNTAGTGRTRGSRNKATTAALALMNGQLEAITQRLIDAAINGYLTAAKIILDKLVPPCRELPLQAVTLPTVTEAADLAKLTAAILQAVADGEVTPSQAAALSALATSHAKAIETTELEARITKLENMRGHHELKTPHHKT